MNEHDQTQLAITATVTLIWLACVIVCFLKWKTWTAIFGIIAPILSNIPIGGMYLHHIITEPFIYIGLPAAAVRLAKPVSWWAKWFYWGPMGSDRQLRQPSPKLARALVRFPEQTVDFEKPESPSPPPPTSECEEIATTINRFVKAGYIAKAQELLELSLDDYFVLQLAMFADKKVNAYATIAAWKQAGLRLPAEDTPEFYPYGDSPSVTKEQLKAEVDKPETKAHVAIAEKSIGSENIRRGSDKISEVPLEELDREVGIKPDELLGLFQILSQISAGINDWLNPPSGVVPKRGIEMCDNLIAQLPKLSSGLTALHDRIQEIWDRAGFDYKIIDCKVPSDQIRVKCGDLLSLAKARSQISNELNQWVHPESVVPNEGQDTLGHLIDRLDAFAPALRSMTATLDGIRERNFGETSE